MHKFYTEKSLTTRWERYISPSITNEVLKNTRRSKNYRNSIYPEARDHSSSRTNLSPEVVQKSTLTRSPKLNKLMSKISNLALKQTKITTLSEKLFRKNIDTKIKGLKKFNTEKEKEVKERNEVVKEFSKSIKGNMFTISKSGKKFREIKLRQRLSSIHTKAQ